MRCKYHFSGLIGLVFLSVCAIAAAQPVAPPNVHVGYCPSPQQLVLNNLFWSAPGGWVSYTESFDKKVIQFEKAQWQGVNVGKILCIYAGDSSFSFPIVLEQKNTQIVPAPQFASWTADQGGYKNCVSNRTEDCPFEITQALKKVDPYQEIDFFKNRKQN
jgi:hypothetical protein